MLNRKALILVLGLWSLAATAQVPVVEAGSRRGQPVAQAQAPVAQTAQAESNDLLLTLYNQLEALQREVQTLRGMVEEQANELRRLQTENRDRYLDVDRRLSELSGGAAAAATGLAPPVTGIAPQGGAAFPPAATPQAPFNDQQDANAPPIAFGNATATGTQAPAINQPTTGAPSVTGGAAITQAPAAGQAIGAELNEQDLYRNALNILLEQQPARYEESIAMFRNYIQRFPQGRLLTNAYYWLGEALILVERYEEARDAFTTIITNYPDDPKAAGALLKRGEVYQRMGQRELAEQDWRDISIRYPENATEIREADTRLRRR